MIRQLTRCAVSLLGTALLWVAVSYANYYRQLHIPCGDCFVEFGLPLKFWVEGGFGGTRLFIPVGLFGDIGLIVSVAMAIAWTWGRIVSK